MERIGSEPDGKRLRIFVEKQLAVKILYQEIVL
jgi:hypothetical protein